jgi:serine protease Do
VTPFRLFGRLLLPGLLSLLALAGGARADGTPAEADPAGAALEKARKIEKSLMTAVDRVRKSSVSVLNKHVPRNPKGEQLAVEPIVGGVGSGVIVSYSGRSWVITNQHVIQGADALTVITHDGVELDVRLHDSVEKYDFALLTFVGKPKGLVAVPVRGSCSKCLEEGGCCVATGNPFFLAMDGRCVCTMGVVSGTERILGGEFFYGSAIQHDAEVNPGNSGGPLWNAKGELVGINGKIATTPQVQGAGPSNSGASFSIPIHQVEGFLKLLVKDGDAQAGYLGLEVETEIDVKGNPTGAKVKEIRPGSPAGKGLAKTNPLLPGDVITKLVLDAKDFPVKNASDFTNALVLYPAGAKASIVYKRGGKVKTWTGALGSG